MSYWKWLWNKEKNKGDVLLWIWVLIVVVDGSILFPHMFLAELNNTVLFVSAVIMGILILTAFICMLGSMAYDLFKDSYEEYKKDVKKL